MIFRLGKFNISSSDLSEAPNCKQVVYCLYVLFICLLQGLKLIVNVDQQEYLPNITTKAGVRVVVHPRDSFPFPEDVGVDASVGVSTSLGLRKVRMLVLEYQLH